MKKLLLPLLALLTACGISAPPRDSGQWQTTVQGVQITWRATSPAALDGGQFVGLARWIAGGTSCVVDIDLALSRADLARVAAHEAGHCLQARYLLPGLPRPDYGPYYADPTEGYAETYARAYLAECGDSLKPLGWVDFVEPRCTEPPDPHR